MQREPLAVFLNAQLATSTPAKAFLTGVFFAFAASAGMNTLRRGRIIHRTKRGIFRFVRKVAAPLVEKEIKKACSGFSFKLPKSGPVYEALPAKGTPSVDVVQRVASLHQELDEDFSKGGISGTVYHGGADHTAFVNQVMELFQWTNPLHVDTYPAVRKMEAEIAAMTVAMYNGSVASGECGSVTTGGSESICMALKVYRDMALKEKGITAPNIVMGQTAHPAFDKGSGYYGIEVIKVPCSEVTGQVDPAELEKNINCNTIAIVGSAPCFPWGTVDPIAELSEIALKHDVGLHVDACLGGFVVPFLGKAGAPTAPIVDFRLKGVTTISCDTHKYGFAPKGTSVIMYRSQRLRRYQYFSVADWPGGLYASPSAPGSKPGNVIAATWAAMVHLGEEGYVESTRRISQTVYKIAEGLRKIPGVYVIGNPTVCALGFSSSDVDVYVINERLQQRGWMLSPLQFPPGIQFSITLNQTRGDVADRFVSDVREVSEALRTDRRARIARGEKVEAIGAGGSTMYGGQQRVPDRSILEDVTKAFFDTYYDTKPPAKQPKVSA